MLNDVYIVSPNKCSTTEILPSKPKSSNDCWVCPMNATKPQLVLAKPNKSLALYWTINVVIHW